MRRLTTLFSLAAASALVCIGTAGPAAAAAPRTTTDPAQAAAGWLAQQFDDHFDYPGSTYFDGGSTADAIFALAAAKSGATKIGAAITYFAAHVNDYTSISDTSGKPGPYDGSVGKSALAAIVAGADPTHFGGYDLIAALHRDQCATVSKPTDGNDFTTPNCPAVGAARNVLSSVAESFAILAQARSSQPPDAAATRYFLSLQCPNGGFTTEASTSGGCTSDVDSTGYAVAALVALGGHSAAAQHAASWLLSVRNADGSWTSNGGENVDSTGLAAAALAATGHDTSTSRSWLAGQQVTTGPTVGTGASRGALNYQGAFDPAASIKSTADGLVALAGHTSLATLTAAGASAGTAVLALPAPTLQTRAPLPGSTEAVVGRGFAAGEQVSAALAAGAALAHAAADRSGTVHLSVVLPAGLASGAHALVLTGASSGLISSAGFTMPSAASAPPAPPAPPVANPPGGTPPVTSAPILASTGQDRNALRAEFGIGVACVLAGGLVTLAARRRRT